MSSVKAKMGDRTIIIKASKAPKGAPRSKRPGANDSPSRRRYWAEGRLQKHKVKAIMDDTGLSKEKATALWLASRTTRKR